MNTKPERQKNEQWRRKAQEQIYEPKMTLIHTKWTRKHKNKKRTRTQKRKGLDLCKKTYSNRHEMNKQSEKRTNRDSPTRGHTKWARNEKDRETNSDAEKHKNRDLSTKNHTDTDEMNTQTEKQENEQTCRKRTNRDLCAHNHRHTRNERGNGLWPIDTDVIF